MKALHVFVAAIVVSFPLLSQSQLGPVPTACGALPVSMAVSLDDTQHSLAQPEPGKALIYFVQDAGEGGTLAYPTTKIGIDGTWVGANKKNSYFVVAIAPGEHHLCAAIQSSFASGMPEFAHLAVEAGKVYYFRTRIIFAERTSEYFSLVPVDSDEGKFLIQSYPLAKAHARK
jgi:hypothetical protein